MKLAATFVGEEGRSDSFVFEWTSSVFFSSMFMLADGGDISDQVMC